MSNRVVTAHIPIDLAEQVDLLAARLDRPKGWIVRQALTSWVELEAKRHQLTLDGLADVDANPWSIIRRLWLGLRVSIRRDNLHAAAMDDERLL